MKTKRFMSYLITVVMLAGTAALPATASAHGYRSDGYSYRDYGRRHRPAPKWRKHWGHHRVRRGDFCAPHGRSAIRGFRPARTVRRGRGGDLDIIVRGYRD